MKAQADWMAWVREGDVLTNGRAFRAIREVTRKADGRLHMVTFAIRNRSWTRRPDTTYSAHDLRTGKWRPAGVRLKLDSELDRRFRAYLQADNGRGERRNGNHPYSITPEEVRGLP